MKNDNNAAILAPASFTFHAVDTIFSIIEAIGNIFEENTRRVLSLVASTFHFASSFLQVILDVMQNNISNFIASLVKFCISAAKLAHALYARDADYNIESNALKIGSNTLNGIYTMFNMGHATVRGIQFAQLNNDNDALNRDRPKMQ